MKRFVEGEDRKQALAKISPVTVKVQDRVNPTFGSWTGLQYMQSQKAGKEGYIDMVASFTGAAPDLVQSPITKNLGYTIKDANPVSATEFVPFTFATQASSLGPSLARNSVVHRSLVSTSMCEPS